METVWGDKNNNTFMGQLQVLQNKAAKVLLNLPPRSSSTEALDRLDLKVAYYSFITVQEVYTINVQI